MTDHAQQGPLTGVVPHITIGEGRAAEAIDFYAKAFGAEEQMRMAGEDGKRLMHVHLIINGGSLMMHDDYPEYTGAPVGAPNAVGLHLEVDDADRWFERAVAAGATVTMPLEDQFWGDRYGNVKDPFGHTWGIGAPIKKDS